jgi:signal transduction histidine kinase
MPSTISTDQPAVVQTMAETRQRAFAVTSAIRLAAGSTFAALGGAWTRKHGFELSVLIYPLLAYLALAAVAFACRRGALAARLAWAMPFFDLGIAFLVLRVGLLIDAAHGTAWAVSSLGVLTLVVALIGLSLPVRLVAALTLLAAVAEFALLRAAGLSLWPGLVATCSLGFVAVATSAVPRQTEVALRQKHEAASARASLVEAQEQNQQLEHLQREKDTLVEVIVHDMRSPVSATILSLEYLAMELKKMPGQAALLEAVDDALSTSNSLANMIAQILDTSKLEAGRITLRLEDIELRRLLESALQEAVPRARSRSITVTLEAPDALKAAVDLRLFSRLLEVLVTHSLRHTPEDGRVLLAATGGVDEVRISIHNSGPAIPASERGAIFEKFPSKLPSEGQAARPKSAWGLGLYFCRLVVEAHQGRISMDDVDGWPMSFVIRLPPQTKSA